MNESAKNIESRVVRTIELVNTHVRSRNVSLSLADPWAEPSPGSLKRHTAPLSVNVPPGAPIEMCRLLGVSYEHAVSIINWSPEVKRARDLGHLRVRYLENGEEIEDGGAPAEAEEPVESEEEVESLFDDDDDEEEEDDDEEEEREPERPESEAD